MPAFLTLAGPIHLETPSVKGSRFIAEGAPVQTEDDARDFIRQIQIREPSATHHCFAWRLGSGDQGWRASDDGEPRGTAGMPILARIDGAVLRGLVVVVTRYFGGTKLGRGGLIRAYGGAAGLLLKEAKLMEVHDCRRLEIHLAYRDQGLAQSVLKGLDLKPLSEDFGAAIALEIAVPLEKIETLQRQLMNRSAGRIQAVLID